MESTYFKDTNGDLVERVTSDRAYSLESLQQQLQFLQAQQASIGSELARITALIEKYDTVR